MTAISRKTRDTKGPDLLKALSDDFLRAATERNWPFRVSDLRFSPRTAKKIARELREIRKFLTPKNPQNR